MGSPTGSGGSGGPTVTPEMGAGAHPVVVLNLQRGDAFRHLDTTVVVEEIELSRTAMGGLRAAIKLQDGRVLTRPATQTVHVLL